MNSNRFILSFLGVIALALYSFTLIVPYTGGDQEHYRNFYDAIADATVSDILPLSFNYLGSYEPLSIVVLWIGSKMGIDKDIYISILNSLLIFLIASFLRRNKTDWPLIILFITNYYVIVLMTGAERLKIAYIFVMLSALIHPKWKSVFMALAVLSHFQTLILLTSRVVASLEHSFRRLVANLSIKKRDVTAFLTGVSFISVFLYFFYVELLSKIKTSLHLDYDLSNFLQLGILVCIALCLVKRKIRVILVAAALLPFLVLLGGSRVNMIAFTAIIFLVILERKQNTIPIYLLMLYLSVKSIPFVINIYKFGSGFSEN